MRAGIAARKLTQFPERGIRDQGKGEENFQLRQLSQEVANGM
jgi:hypothetical protein